VQLADKASTSINSMSQDVLRLNEVVVGISHSLREQAAATNEITRHIEQISAMSQSSSQAAKVVMREADGLNRIAEGLAESVVRFRLP
jgi:methyl-accepting chemotaxis protein